MVKYQNIQNWLKVTPVDDAFECIDKCTQEQRCEEEKRTKQKNGKGWRIQTETFLNDSYYSNTDIK